MKKLLYLSIAFLSLAFLNVASAEVIGVVDFDKVAQNYSKVKSVSDEISDKYSEIQRFGLDKEREYKKLTTALERKNFEEATQKELAKKQDALLRLKEKKEAEIDTAMKNAIKTVAIENKIDTLNMIKTERKV